MVQETQTDDLPNLNPEPVEERDWSLLYDCNIGGVNFAILEDRKFKSAPKALLPEGRNH